MVSNVKNNIHLPRQQVAFHEECRKIKGCGSLEEDFYTRFKPNFKSLGCGMAKKMNSISAEISIDSAEISKAN